MRVAIQARDSDEVQERAHEALVRVATALGKGLDGFVDDRDIAIVDVLAKARRLPAVPDDGVALRLKIPRAFHEAARRAYQQTLLDIIDDVERLVAEHGGLVEKSVDRPEVIERLKKSMACTDADFVDDGRFAARTTAWLADLAAACEVEDP